MKVTNLIRICFLLCFCNYSRAQQNLVPNPSFENYSSCPSGSGQLTLALEWLNPTGGTPDYYNSCSQFTGVPSNGPGFQYAKTGNAYAAVYCKEKPFPNEREYISAKLISKLQENRYYKVTFFISLANISKYFHNRMGLYFSDELLSGNNYEPLSSYIPQIENPINYFLKDTLYWMSITGNYKANGTENYITIGNFYDDFNTHFDSVQFGADISYYYIDDVSVIACDTCEKDTSKTNNIFIPDAFSPNGDGNNDKLFVRGNNIQELYFAVYDRWGENVFETTDKNNGWDGTYKGNQLSGAVFVYYCKGKYTDGLEFKQKGDVTLVR